LKRNSMDFGGADEAAFAKKKSGEETDLDITPMIDVTFLLLIFFMVTSTMQESSNITPPVAHHGEGTDTEDSVTISIAAPLSNDDTPEIKLGSKNDSPVGEMTEITGYIDRELVGAGKNHVIIKADKNVPFGFVQQVMREVNKREGIKFHVGVEDQRN